MRKIAIISNVLILLACNQTKQSDNNAGQFQTDNIKLVCMDSIVQDMQIFNDETVINTTDYGGSEQIFLPDKSIEIDTIKRSQLRQIVDEINTMQLKCDTVIFEPFDKDTVYSHFKGVYFDNKRQLRKYFRKDISTDGSNECITMAAYYNEKGELVYIFLDTYYNCGDGKEFYYVYKGRIVDFEGNMNCDCCDEELLQEEINRLRPVIGNPLTVSINWELNLMNFIYADKLLKILRSKEYIKYGGHGEFDNYNE